jgi:hypothetical protein
MSLKFSRQRQQYNFQPMKTYFFTLFILLLMACEQQQKPASSKKNERELITYYTYGEIPPAGYIYYDTVFAMQKYRFKVRNMGGCEPEGVDYEDLENRNKKTAVYMSKKFGKNWANDFKQQTGLKIILP